MSATLTEKEFSQHVNTKFRVATEPPLELELKQVKRYLGGTNDETGMERFSVFFYGAGERLLRQGIYLLEHEAMGSFELFLVPVGKTESGYQYEAVFNYYRQ
jgi:hypothetical protein